MTHPTLIIWKSVKFYSLLPVYLSPFRLEQAFRSMCPGSWSEEECTSPVLPHPGREGQKSPLSVVSALLLMREGVSADLRDAAWFHESPVFSVEKEEALQLQLFYDNFKTTNPPGSKEALINSHKSVLLQSRSSAQQCMTSSPVTSTTLSRVNERWNLTQLVIFNMTQESSFSTWENNIYTLQSFSNMTQAWWNTPR